MAQKQPTEAPPLRYDLFDRSKLEGAALDLAVALKFKLDARIESGACVYRCGDQDIAYTPSTDWATGGPLIDDQQVFLDPPTTVHVSGGPNAGWRDIPKWRATVSARVRTRPNPNDPALPPFVGRGSGETPLIAACRAIVDSFGDTT